jgi:hypothetical protein
MRVPDSTASSVLITVQSSIMKEPTGILDLDQLIFKLGNYLGPQNILRGIN